MSVIVWCMFCGRGEFETSNIVQYIQPSYSTRLFSRYIWYHILIWLSLTCRNNTLPLLSQTCLLCTQGFAVFHYKTKWIALIFRTLLAPQQEVLGILMSSYCQHSTLTLTSQTADKVVHSRPLSTSVYQSSRWLERREGSGRPLCSPSCLSLTNVETVAFANEEQGDDGQNMCTVMGVWEVEGRSSTQHPPNRWCLCRKWTDCKGL